MKKKVKKSKDNYDIRNEYKKSWDYIKESRNFIILGVVLFFVFSLVGYFAPAPEILIEQVQNLIQELFEKTKDMNQFELTTFILVNNTQVSFFAMLFGFFIGVLPIVSLITNGYVAGFVGRLATDEIGLVALLNFVPHGIFELPAIFISMGLGIKFGTFIFQKNKSEAFRRLFLNSIRVFFYIVLPLLIIAAIIEGAFIFLV